MNIHGGNHIQITAYVDCTRRRPRRCYYGDEVNDPDTKGVVIVKSKTRLDESVPRVFVDRP